VSTASLQLLLSAAHICVGARAQDGSAYPITVSEQKRFCRYGSVWEFADAAATNSSAGTAPRAAGRGAGGAEGPAGQQQGGREAKRHTVTKPAPNVEKNGEPKTRPPRKKQRDPTGQLAGRTKRRKTKKIGDKMPARKLTPFYCEDCGMSCPPGQCANLGGLDAAMEAELADKQTAPRATINRQPVAQPAAARSNMAAPSMRPPSSARVALKQNGAPDTRRPRKKRNDPTGQLAGNTKRKKTKNIG
jgi:hypothetical protein